MLKKVITFVFLCCFLFKVNNVSAKVSEFDTSIVVSDVIGFSKEKQKEQAKRDLLIKAKEDSFSFLNMYLKEQDVFISAKEVEKCMVDVSLKEIRKVSDGYIGIFDVFFDKVMIEELISSSVERVDYVDDHILLQIITSNTFHVYSSFKNVAKLIGLDFDVITIKSNSVEFLVKNIDYKDLESSLLKHNMEIVRNNKLMFIKFIDLYE
ncbi:hypothetical protein N9A04_00925 [Rickettsiales bacterium]|nr:hypothetical protein [Rickettsiales bacterium]